MFKADSGELPPATRRGDRLFLRRYADFFTGQTLRGKRVLVYQHSAVGRDFLVELLRHFGAEVIPAGRSEKFVPIDTEAIDAEQSASFNRSPPPPGNSTGHWMPWFRLTATATVRWFWGLSRKVQAAA